jgi:hypothetical protein
MVRKANVIGLGVQPEGIQQGNVHYMVTVTREILQRLLSQKYVKFLRSIGISSENLRPNYDRLKKLSRDVMEGHRVPTQGAQIKYGRR